jgi:hypothetical protein
MYCWLQLEQPDLDGADDRHGFRRRRRIVMIENVARYIEQNSVPPLQAALQGSAQIGHDPVAQSR